MITVFLGAGFSFLGGVPLARDLFAEEPQTDRITRRRLIERVLTRWEEWHQRHGGMPEEYLAYLQNYGGKGFPDAVWYVSLIIALKMGRLELVGLKPTITRHNIDRTSGIETHEQFWSTIFRKTSSITVLTTNYDILAERGLRHVARPRVPRPGFHYGHGAEHLAGGGYPSYAHIKKITVQGSVPLLKLHGSISWSLQNGELVRYHDCRPAIRGDAAIIAPMTEKKMPDFLKPLWSTAREALQNSQTWIFVGYSLPEYDHLVLDLLRSSAKHQPNIYIFDPLPTIAKHYNKLLGVDVSAYPGIPDGLPDLKEIVEKL